jgi:hypothetical protein
MLSAEGMLRIKEQPDAHAEGQIQKTCISNMMPPGLRKRVRPQGTAGTVRHCPIVRSGFSNGNGSAFHTLPALILDHGMPAT